MADRPFKQVFARRKELMFFTGALVVCAIFVASGVSGWLEEENWGPPITVRPINEDSAVPEVTLPDFRAIWQNGGRNPFGDAAIELTSGGKAKIQRPLTPPLVPEMPPPPMVRPIDLLMEGGL